MINYDQSRIEVRKSSVNDSNVANSLLESSTNF